MGPTVGKVDVLPWEEAPGNGSLGCIDGPCRAPSFKTSPSIFNYRRHQSNHSSIYFSCLSCHPHPTPQHPTGTAHRCTVPNKCRKTVQLSIAIVWNTSRRGESRIGPRIGKYWRSDFDGVRRIEFDTPIHWIENAWKVKPKCSNNWCIIRKNRYCWWEFMMMNGFGCAGVHKISARKNQEDEVHTEILVCRVHKWHYFLFALYSYISVKTRGWCVYRGVPCLLVSKMVFQVPYCL